MQLWRTTLFFCCLLLFLTHPLPARAQQRNIILATTTSTQDSGLLDLLIPIFQKRTGYFVKINAVGSGQAIAFGRRGEADVLLVHSPEDERRMVQEGYGIHRRRVMHNEFIIVGPPDDVAQLKGLMSATEAFKKIASFQSLFLSRGDHSGTHMKEKALWSRIGIRPEGKKWYQETGLGMGQTLNIASEKKGYTFTDRGTYMALRKNLGLRIYIEGDPILLNLYHVVEVNPERGKKVNARGAKAFADFLVSKEAQDLIRTFGVDQFGSPLFIPDAGKREEELGR